MGFMELTLPRLRIGRLIPKFIPKKAFNFFNFKPKTVLNWCEVDAREEKLLRLLRESQDLFRKYDFAHFEQGFRPRAREGDEEYQRFRAREEAEYHSMRKKYDNLRREAQLEFKRYDGILAKTFSKEFRAVENKSREAMGYKPLNRDADYFRIEQPSRKKEIMNLWNSENYPLAR